MTFGIRITVFAIVVTVACFGIAQEQQGSAPQATAPSSNPAPTNAQQPEAQPSPGPATQDQSGANQSQSTPEPQNPQPAAPAASESTTPKKNASPHKKQNAKNSTRRSKTTKACSERSGSTSTKCGQQHAGQTPTGQSGKVVVRHGGATDESVLLSPSLTKEQQLQDKQKTEQLLATTDNDLKKLAGRQLTTSQSSMLDQINAYVRQAKSASDAGDFARAHTLAYKAHLLSDELMKR